MTNYFPQLRRPAFGRWSCGLLLALLLTACDGGDDAEPAVSTPPVTPPASSVDNGTTPPAGNPSLGVASISTTLYSPDGKLLSGSTVNVGDIVTFHATVSGGEPSGYQWYRNGVAIEGANADSYALGQINSIDDKVLFSVRVSSAVNSAGTLSQPVSLTVRPGNGIDLLAGWLGGFGNADGQGVAARFFWPTEISSDANGNLFVIDGRNYTIRKITPTGMVTTLAGTAGQSDYVDGRANNAKFSWPTLITADASGNTYVVDRYAIRKIGNDGTTSTLAGQVFEAGAVDGLGAVARFRNIAGLCSDKAGNLYVAANSSIRKINPSGSVSTFAGANDQTGNADGVGSNARFHSPQGIACAADGTIYVADTGNAAIRTISPIGIVKTLPNLPTELVTVIGQSSVTSLAVDNDNDLLVLDKRKAVIYRLTASGRQSIVAQQGSATDDGIPLFGESEAGGITVDGAGNVYVVDTKNNSVRKITKSNQITTLAGRGAPKGNINRITGSAPYSLAPTLTNDATGNIYVTDPAENIIRKISPAGIISVFAGKSSEPGQSGETANNTQFSGLANIVADVAGNLYVADTDTIRKIKPDGQVSTLAGMAGKTGNVDGHGSEARLTLPYGLTIDASGTLFVAESIGNIRRITPDGSVTTFANVSLINARNLVIDRVGNLYSTRGFAIIKITSDGQVSTLAGSEDQSGSNDGAATDARFSYMTGIALDAAGNLYISDGDLHTIRKLTPSGQVSTIAGRSGIEGTQLGALPGGLNRPDSIVYGQYRGKPALFVLNEAVFSFLKPSFSPRYKADTNIVVVPVP